MRLRVRRAAAILTLTGLGLSGCAADPDPSPPAGVDELTIPIATPDPDDFVDTVDHPWLALGPGESTTLAATPGSSGEVVVTVSEPTSLGGVPVTGVEVGDASYLLAQDGEGNVWQLVEGDPAGLYLPATPRYGDGWGATWSGTDATTVAEVSELDGDVLEITTRSRSDDRADQVATYEKGVGLVRLETAYGVFER